MPRSGADLALLLLGGYRVLIDAAMDELAARGHEDVRPAYEFAMRAIESGARNASDLGRRMSVTKQSAARTIEVLLERGYISRDTDPHDARRKYLAVTPLGFDVMREGEQIFDQLRTRLRRKIGSKELAALEASLTALVGDSPVRLDAPGWAADAG